MEDSIVTFYQWFTPNKHLYLFFKLVFFLASSHWVPSRISMAWIHMDCHWLINWIKKLICIFTQDKTPRDVQKRPLIWQYKFQKLSRIKTEQTDNWLDKSGEMQQNEGLMNAVRQSNAGDQSSWQIFSFEFILWHGLFNWVYASVG